MVNDVDKLGDNILPEINGEWWNDNDVDKLGDNILPEIFMENDGWLNRKNHGLVVNRCMIASDGWWLSDGWWWLFDDYLMVAMLFGNA